MPRRLDAPVSDAKLLKMLKMILDLETGEWNREKLDLLTHNTAVGNFEMEQNISEIQEFHWEKCRQ